MSSDDEPPRRAGDARDGTLELVRRALANLAYGEITLVVHAGEVVQIERCEKLRVKAR